jgi:uncharacterized membrane protein YedE/YeeE
MNHAHSRANRHLWVELHPLVSRITLGLAIWSIAAMWIFFDHSYYGPLLFAVVTVLVVIFMGLPWILLSSRRDTDERQPRRFRDWVHGELDTASGPIDARHAAIIILSVPVSVAVGFTVFGLLEYLTAIGVLT